MRRTIPLAVFVIASLLLPGHAAAQLKLLQRIDVPGDVPGHFDHFGVDLEHNRLFATPEGGKSLEVFDIRSGAHLQTVSGIKEPHAVLYRADLNRIYVTDGEDGSLRIIDGTSYRIIKTVELRRDADSIAYDPNTRYLYVVNGGKDADLNYSMISVIATDTGELIREIRINSNSVEAMALESRTPRMYVNNRAQNKIEVIDRAQGQILATWPLTKGKVNVSMGFDEEHHRLFVGCRDGGMLVLDTNTGAELQRLPIANGTDDIVFDPATKRIYEAGDGAVDIYEEENPDRYKHLASVPTAPIAKTARLVPELQRYFVAAPKSGAQAAQILVFKVL